MRILTLSAVGWWVAFELWLDGGPVRWEGE
jgi:hypothetical protein